MVDRIRQEACELAGELEAQNLAYLEVRREAVRFASFLIARDAMREVCASHRIWLTLHVARKQKGLRKRKLIGGMFKAFKEFDGQLFLNQEAHLPITEDPGNQRFENLSPKDRENRESILIDVFPKPLDSRPTVQSNSPNPS